MGAFVPPAKRYSGYIFDCDGTLADSMPIHYLAWDLTIRQLGGQFPEDLFYSLGGVPSTEIVRILNTKFGSHLDPQMVADKKERLYLEKLELVRPIVEVTQFAREVAQFAKVSVASGGIFTAVTRTLEAIGFANDFQFLVTNEDVQRGKPFPDIFLEAARRMRVDFSDCLVFEDSPSGIEAAKAAGMDYVLVKIR
ncbi:MAG: HAD family phosphatase [Verrucomicrobia bacterium]|nr:HAD family phosphatase [Verrucomicrobiota bacterium]